MTVFVGSEVITLRAQLDVTTTRVPGAVESSERPDGKDRKERIRASETAVDLLGWKQRDPTEWDAAFRLSLRKQVEIGAAIDSRATRVIPSEAREIKRAHEANEALRMMPEVGWNMTHPTGEKRLQTTRVDRKADGQHRSEGGANRESRPVNRN